MSHLKNSGRSCETASTSRWGIEPDELLLEFPCDRYAADYDSVFFRGVTIETSPEVVFRWVCQLRVAPYSYDWIDNIGRRSPQTLIPGLEQLAVGQSVMGFELIDFEAGRQITIRNGPNDPILRIFGEIVGSYLIVPRGLHRCRLLVKLYVKYPKGALGRLMSLFLPWGDMIMMRRQLLNIRTLSERARRTKAAPLFGS